MSFLHSFYLWYTFRCDVPKPLLDGSEQIQNRESEAECSPVTWDQNLKSHLNVKQGLKWQATNLSAVLKC